MFWELVRAQRGLVSRRQARELGWTDRRLAAAVSRGELELVLPTVFRHRASPRSAWQFVMAVDLWLDGAGALSGMTAARIWELERIPRSPVVIVTSWTRRSPHPDIEVRRGRLDPEMATRRHGVLVTTAARTLVDLAGCLPRSRLESAVESAFRAGWCTPADVASTLSGLGSTFRGRGRLVEWLEQRGDGPALEFELEQRAFAAIVSSGLPVPVRQHEVTVDGVDWSLDLAWPERRLAVECDGFGSHSSPEAFRQDRVKLAAVASVGWRVVPVTWDEITIRTERFLGRLRDALNR